MKEIIEILDKIRSTSKTSEKISILQFNHRNELLKTILYHTYNPYLKYGIKLKETDITQSTSQTVTTKFNNIFELLKVLEVSNMNDNIRRDVYSFLASIPHKEERQLYIMIINKDLEIGCNVKTINKVWENLIPSFNVQLAENYFNTTLPSDTEVTITTKLDGNRVIIIRQDNTVKFYTRQGYQIQGLTELEEQVLQLPTNRVYDGEILSTTNNSTCQDVSRLLRSTNTKVKTGLRVVLFDVIPLNEFMSGKSTTAYGVRIQELVRCLQVKPFTLISLVPIVYQGVKPTEETILKLLETEVNKGNEGLMLNVNSAPYEFKRTKSLLKIKKFQTADVLVKSVIEGTGKYQGKLGAIEILFNWNGNQYTCNCGSGFTDEQREYYYKNQSLIVGKVVEVTYFEVTKNDKGTYGLRFPVFKFIREDKTDKDLSTY